MFFILSKTVSYLTQPLVIVSLLLIGSIFVHGKKWKKRLRIAAIGLLVIFTNDFLANEVIGLYETPITPLNEIQKQYEWGVVLTGVTSTNKEVTDRVYVTSSPDRVNHSFMLYKKGIIKKILISGGSGQLLDPTYSEARELYSMYLMMGVPPSHLAIEGESRNTYESAVAVKKMLTGIAKPSDCLLITSGYHLPRSLACFKKVDWPCDVFSTDIRNHKRQWTPDAWLVPKSEAIGTWNVGAVTNMSSMFSRAFAFNQNLSTWNTGNVSVMVNMFGNATAFNQYIGDWNVAKVAATQSMFENATAFNQNLGKWDMRAIFTANMLKIKLKKI